MMYTTSVWDIYDAVRTAHAHRIASRMGHAGYSSLNYWLIADCSSGGISKAEALLADIKDCVELAHEHITQDPQVLREIQAHEA